MALDFMAAKNKREAVRSTLVYSMQETEHEALMNLAVSSRKYPIICRFSDYYRDSTILSGEIAVLLHELKELDNLNPNRLPEITSFHQFLLMTQQIIVRPRH